MGRLDTTPVTLVGRRDEAEKDAAPQEPATPRALWPTFMRRTLAEESLRREDAVAMPRGRASG